MKPPRRRRQFATPFVLTAVLSPACTVQTEPPPSEPRPAAATDNGGATGATTPGPIGDAPAEAPPGGVNSPPQVITNPPRPQPQSDVPAGWTVQKNADGTCSAVPPPPNCPPKATCNPPPPRKIDCPPDSGPTQK